MSIWNVVEIYILRKQHRDAFYLELLECAESLFGDSLISFKKNWVHGYHIQIVLEKKADKRLEEMKAHILQMFDAYPKTEDAAEIRAVEAQLKTVAGFERYEGSFLPVFEDKTLVIKEIDTDNIQFSKVFSNEDFLKAEKIKAEWLQKNGTRIKNCIENGESERLAAALMLITAAHFKFGFWSGLRYGALSYYSHYQGFLAQAQSRKDDSMLVRLEAAKEDKQELLQRLSEIENGDYKTDRVLFSWDKACDAMAGLFETLLEKQKVTFERLQSIEEYLSGQNRVSEFHKVFTMNDNFYEFAESQEFKTYRLLVNELYQLFPMIKISALQKIKLCKLVSETVFEQYDMDWKNFYTEIQTVGGR